MKGKNKRVRHFYGGSLCRTLKRELFKDIFQKGGSFDVSTMETKVLLKKYFLKSTSLTMSMHNWLYISRIVKIFVTIKNVSKVVSKWKH